MSDIAKKPGRPRKYVELEEKVEVVLPVQEEVKVEKKILPNMALGMAKDHTHNWCVYSFKFDPHTKEVEFLDVKKEFSKVSATSTFKKMAITILK